MLLITFSNGKVFNFNNSISINNLMKFVDSDIKNNCVAVKVNNNFVYSDFILDKNSNLTAIFGNNNDGLEAIRYSCIYLLGYTIKNLWPSTKMGSFSVTKDGFYYDVECDKSLNKKDLKEIEKEMHASISKGVVFFKKKFFLRDAVDVFLKSGQNYKLEILKDYENEFKKYVNLHFYKDYVDIDCDKSHVFDIKFCRNFKLLNVSGVFWKENKNKILQRIYGIAYFTKKDLLNYFFVLKQKNNRDHRKIAKNLNLYYLLKDFPGMIFWDKNGLILINELKKFIRSKLEYYMYKEVKTPLMLNSSVWKKTGHWENYKENIFITEFENQKYCIKPMNCPGHIEIFKQHIRSYRDLPLRIAEFGICHRNEPSGSLHGLMRSREFIQDDAHIFCTNKQILKEVKNCIKMVFDVYKTFGFKKILISLSTRPKKRIGNDKDWDDAENDLTKALGDMKFNYKSGEGAFYGPKIEFTLCDCLGRFWQCGTIQLDFSLSVRLGACYMDKGNKKRFPIIIHRAILGSLERFIGILIEHYSGFFPLWLSPIQVVIINVTDAQIEFIKILVKKMICFKIRVQSDFRNETVSFKIRDNTLKRIPYILVCGEKEIKSNSVSVRNYNGVNLGIFGIDIFINKILKEIKDRSIFC